MEWRLEEYTRESCSRPCGGDLADNWTCHCGLPEKDGGVWPTLLGAYSNFIYVMSELGIQSNLWQQVATDRGQSLQPIADLCLAYY